MAKIAGFFVTKNTVFQMTIDTQAPVWNFYVNPICSLV